MFILHFLGNYAKLFYHNHTELLWRTSWRSLCSYRRGHGHSLCQNSGGQWKGTFSRGTERVLSLCCSKRGESLRFQLSFLELLCVRGEISSHQLITWSGRMLSCKTLDRLTINHTKYCLIYLKRLMVQVILMVLSSQSSSFLSYERNGTGIHGWKYLDISLYYI